ncbi:type II toxin-antitoxin system Phd/YefM family antitoxin [bacterium]|nr:type II toxin-antitoxin system Phd/YefM family antitoxin [bacterium]
MRTITFTEFRKNASGFLTEVENGEKLVVLRHGKAIAEISPPDLTETVTPSWKQPRLRLIMKGKSLSRTIIEDREA